jgi:hypothetical protein
VRVLVWLCASVSVVVCEEEKVEQKQRGREGGKKLERDEGREGGRDGGERRTETMRKCSIGNDAPRGYRGVQPSGTSQQSAALLLNPSRCTS